MRVLAACETMGGATAICSDKTGTLTENRMTVVAAQLGGAGAELARPPPGVDDLDPALTAEVATNCCLNSKAFLIATPDGATDFVGNRTECALLVLVKGWGIDYKAARDAAAAAGSVLREYDFSSERKMASVLVASPSVPGGARLHAKGAAEIVVRRCVAAWGPGGKAVPLTDADRTALHDKVTAMAATGLRTIGLAFRDMTARELAGGPPEKAPEEALTLVGVVGIKDPVRAEVPDAVATCQRAGITVRERGRERGRGREEGWRRPRVRARAPTPCAPTPRPPSLPPSLHSQVRMVTGDNIHTAKHIAAECGILTEGGLAMEGPDFRAMPEDDLIALLPRLQVLARSSPADKLILVRTLKKMGDIVAVTGDGTNDAPALKESDVGMAMGIAGTEVAKEAADIVIMDDNFSSIVKAVMWGRSVFCNIRKFLQVGEEGRGGRDGGGAFFFRSTHTSLPPSPRPPPSSNSPSTLSPSSSPLSPPSRPGRPRST